VHASAQHVGFTDVHTDINIVASSSMESPEKLSLLIVRFLQSIVRSAAPTSRRDRYCRSVVESDSIQFISIFYMSKTRSRVLVVYRVVITESDCGSMILRRRIE
jgi:hypothetical protein